MNADKPITQDVYVGDYLRRRCGRGCAVLELVSADHTNKLGIAAVMGLLEHVRELQDEAECGRLKALIITGNDKFFSAGADLKEIARLSGPEAFEFSRTGQRLMNSIDNFPVPVIAAIRGYCMGGGMDLALACDYRIAAPCLDIVERLWESLLAGVAPSACRG